MLKYKGPIVGAYTSPDDFTCPSTAIDPDSIDKVKQCHIHNHGKDKHAVDDDDDDTGNHKHDHCHTGNVNHHN